MSYREKLHKLIPGGAHTYSRGDDQFPYNAPSILSKGEKCYVWDPDGNRYLDYGMALRAVTIGYGYKPIADAALNEILKGNNLTRASEIELKAAEVITDLIDCADMVKFAKNGSTVTTAAVKLARAYTGKKYIAICSDHPFFSYDDWFIGSTVVNKGVPDEIRGMTLKFKYNDIFSVESLFKNYGDQIAAIILEPAVSIKPKDNFLANLRKLCDINSSVLIFDEMITGFRWHLKGAQTYYGVRPDMATFGKGMANGFSVAALVGKREIMDIGSIRNEGVERVFLISTTHGAEMSGLGAFVKTMDTYKKYDVVGHLWNFGQKLIDGMNSISKEFGISDYFYFEGYPCSPVFVTKGMDGNSSMEMRTVFCEVMASKQILMPWISLCYFHGEKELEKTFEAARDALKIYSRALETGSQKYIQGSILKPVFRKEN